jgi:hypothetical protein
MPYTVIMTKKAQKKIAKAPLRIRQSLALLIDDLADLGPIRKEWPNFSSLGNDLYHCHLARSWVAVRRYEKGGMVVEVEYAGSREDAPY